MVSLTETLWSALTTATVESEPLRDHRRTDVLIVGAGFLGLSTALHLAEAGVSVTVLEAEEAGFGASGRNTGFVVPSLKTQFGPGDVARALGAARSENLLDLVGRSGSFVFELIARLGLSCDAEQTGWLQPAHTDAMMEVLARRQAEWQARGKRIDILTRDETARRTGAASFPGALFDPTGGQLNPLAYARGLASALQARGAHLYADSRVIALQRADGGWKATTAHGEVRAERVVLATNALVDTLWPDLSGSIVPVRVHQIATQPLQADVQLAILPDRSPMSDTRRHTLAVRWSPDGRLVTGGLLIPGPFAQERAARTFARRLERFFPQASRLRADFVWSGTIAATLDSLPRFLALGPGLDAAIGCNGRGVALTSALGQAIAQRLTGRLTDAAFPLPTTAPQTIPGRRWAPYVPAFWLPWSNLRDAWDTRT